MEYRPKECQEINPWSLTQRLEEKPLSANAMFTIKRHRTHKYNSYAKRWAEVLVDAKLPDDIEDHSEMYFKLDMKVGLSSSLADLDNCIKPLLDIIQGNLEGFNDKRVLEIHATRYKARKGEEYIEFTLTQIFKELNQ